MTKVVGDIGYGRGVETVPPGQSFEVPVEEAERLVASGYFRVVPDAADAAGAADGAKPAKHDTSRRKVK
jgi:hypothetical protein